MALDLYLVVVDGAGATVPGSSTVAKLKNPLRADAAVTRPFVVRSYAFGADLPFTPAGGGGSGKVEPGELRVEMADDSSAAALFTLLCSGRHVRSVDVLVVAGGARPTVVAAAGVSGVAVLTGLAWATGTSGLQRSLRADGTLFSIGSAAPRQDGSYGPFTSATFDVTTNRVG